MLVTVALTIPPTCSHIFSLTCSITYHLSTCSHTFLPICSDTFSATYLNNFHPPFCPCAHTLSFHHQVTKRTCGLKYPQPNHPFTQPSHPFTQPNHPFTNPITRSHNPTTRSHNHPYTQPNHPFSQPNHPFTQPNHPFTQTHLRFKVPTTAPMTGPAWMPTRMCMKPRSGWVRHTGVCVCVCLCVCVCVCRRSEGKSGWGIGNKVTSKNNRHTGEGVRVSVSA